VKAESHKGHKEEEGGRAGVAPYIPKIRHGSVKGCQMRLRKVKV